MEIASRSYASRNLFTLLWCWRRAWTARRSNQSILKEINSEYSLKGLMLKLQYFGHLMGRANSSEKIPMLEKTFETSGKSNQSILKEINSEYSLGGLMLKLQYFGHLKQRANSLEKTLMLGKMEAGGEGDDRG